MKTKREVLKLIAKDGYCSGLSCNDCPYNYGEYGFFCCHHRYKLSKIGAMAILRMFKEKKNPILEVGTEIKFDNGEVATVVFFRKEYWLMFESHKEKLDYLIGKTWEVV